MRETLDGDKRAERDVDNDHRRLGLHDLSCTSQGGSDRLELPQCGSYLSAKMVQIPPRWFRCPSNKVVQIVWSYRRQSCATPEFFVRELSVVFELLASSLNFLTTSPSPGLTRVPFHPYRGSHVSLSPSRGLTRVPLHPHGGSCVSISPSPGADTCLPAEARVVPMRRIAQLPHLLRLSAPISTTLHRRGIVCA